MRVFYFVFLSITICLSQSRVDGVSAIVGDNVVLHSDVLQQAQFVAMEQKIDPSRSPYLFEKIYYSTLENIINQYIVLNVALKDTNIVVSNDEIDRALNQQIDDFIIKAGSEELFLKMAGMSMRQIKADYWQDIRDMMIVERYQFFKIQSIDVSRVEVKEFYSTYKDSIPVSPETYSFSVIEAPFVAGDKSGASTVSLLNDLKIQIQNEGVLFDSLARIYSQDPGSAPLGGKLGFTPRGALVKEYEKVAYSLNIGEVSEPVKSELGYHLIKLLDKQGEKISTQHILRIPEFSNEDKIHIYNSINKLYHLLSDNSTAIDSIAMVYSSKYNNGSGKFDNYQRSHIPEYILTQLELLSNNKLSQPLEVENGYMLVYCDNHKDGFMPNLENSWDLIYKYAKQNKQNEYFNGWINKIKKNVFIKVFNQR